MPTNDQTMILLNMTAEIVASYVENNSIPAADLSGLIASVHQGLTVLGQSTPEPAAAAPRGATTVRKSLSNPAHIISMIDGKPYAMLTRHIKGEGYTPQSYRQAFGLPVDYPMTAPAYSEKRRELALAIGLGRKPAPALAPAPKSRAKPRAMKDALAKSKAHLRG